MCPMISFTMSFMKFQILFLLELLEILDIIFARVATSAINTKIRPKASDVETTKISVKLF